MGLITYALAVYFVYHLVAKADLLAAPRGWALRVLPSWLTYPLSCPYCFTTHASVGLTLLAWFATGVLTIRLDLLMAAPVVNYLIGLVAARLNVEPTHALLHVVGGNR